MDKVKNLKTKLLSAYGLLILTAIVGIGLFAYAHTYIENATIYNEAPEPVIEEEGEEEEMFGEMGLKWVKQGNRVTYIESGTFKDATTTLFSFVNPFNTASTTIAGSGITNWELYRDEYLGKLGTSTVVSVNLDITGPATTTIYITCGAADQLYHAPTYDIMTAYLVTSTIGVYTNNQATTSAGFSAAAGTGAEANVLLTHDYSYFTCHATGSPLSNEWGTGGVTADKIKGITGSNNTFDGSWSVEIQKNLE